MLQIYPMFVAVLLFISGITAGNSSGSADSAGNVPNRNTPQNLQEAWLRFHETDLCQEVDAHFEFSGSGMEVRGRFESDKSLQKFRKLFEPLKHTFPIELNLTRAEEDQKEEGTDPPPSLWQNLELRANLGEDITNLAGKTFEERVQTTGSPLPAFPHPFMKQRLKIFAEQTLDLNNSMRQYVLDLEALTAIAYDLDRSHKVQSKAFAICTRHAQNLDRQIVKLTASLELAFPSSEKKKRAVLVDASAIGAVMNPVEKAGKISASTREIARRVDHFIYPEEYTVTLDDLRHPKLLQSLDALRGLVLDFKRSLGQPVQKQ